MPTAIGAPSTLPLDGGVDHDDFDADQVLPAAPAQHWRKPAPEDAPSRLGVAGRYILTPGVFHEIANQPRGVGGEIQLTDGIAGLLRREKVFAYRYDGKRYDCGSKEGFLQANVELALAHPQLGPGFREFLQGLSL